MSMGIDGVIEVVAGAIGSVAYGVGKAAVVAGATIGSAIGKGTVALAKLTANAATEVGSAIADSFGEIAQIHKLAEEQNRRAKQAYKNYTEAVNTDKNKQEEFIKKLNSLVNFNALGINDDGMTKINQLENFKKIQVLNAIIDVQSKFDSISNLFYELSERGVELECEYDFFAIKNEFVADVNDGKFDFSALNEKSNLILQTLRNTKFADDNKDVMEFIAAQTYQIENQLDTPQVLCFSTELYDMLQAESVDVARLKEDELFTMEKNVLQLMQLFSQIDYDFNEKDEFWALVNSVKSELLSEHCVTTKLGWLEPRYRCMMDMYRKICARESEVIALKQRYNEVITLNYMLKEELNMELPIMNFRYNIAEQDIAALTKENEKLTEQVEEQRKQEYIRKTVRETMREMQFEYLCSQKKVTSFKQTVYEDIYHIDNGNVLSVTFTNERVYYSVAGVEMAGIAENKQSVVNSMNKLSSSIKELQDRLAKKGVRYTINEQIEAIEENACQIKLENASAAVIERLRQEKLGKNNNTTLKQKEIK